MLDRRKQHRDRTHLGGQVIYNHRCSTVDCLVRNFNRSGAKLDFASSAFVPSRFEFIVARKGVRRTAQMVWRHDTSMGVVFEEPQTDTVIPFFTRRQIRRLQNDRDALSRRLSDLSEPGI
jgi:hypothetical protein